MSMNFERIIYNNLNARQKEAFNFQKVSAVLADYGFATIRLSSDWRGADFIAQHFDGMMFLKVQLKSRLTFAKKYLRRDLHVCFPSNDEWFLYPHDELLEKVLSTHIAGTESWDQKDEYSFPRIPDKLRAVLHPYRLIAEQARGMAVT